MADDFKTSFVDLIKERTSTPLWANFIFVWCIFNWHVLVLIFYSNSGNAIDLIELIKQHNFAPFLLIFFCSVIVTVIVPLINIGVFYVINWSKQKKDNIRVNFSGQRIYTSEEYNKVNSLYQIEKEKFENLNRKFTDIEKRALDDRNAKFQAIDDLSKVKEINESYDISTQVFHDALWNHSDLKVQIINPYTCNYNGKSYYYMSRKSLSNSYIFVMFNKDLLDWSNPINVESKDIFVLEIIPNHNGKNYDNRIIYLHQT